MAQLVARVNVIDRLHAVVETLLPWYHPVMERQREVRSRHVARLSEVARLRAARVIKEYRAAEDVADRRSQNVTRAVTDLREAQDVAIEAQQAAREAGERVIAEVERNDPA